MVEKTESERKWGERREREKEKGEGGKEKKEEKRTGREGKGEREGEREREKWRKEIAPLPWSVSLFPHVSGSRSKCYRDGLAAGPLVPGTGILTLSFSCSLRSHADSQGSATKNSVAKRMAPSTCTIKLTSNLISLKNLSLCIYFQLFAFWRLQGRINELVSFHLIHAEFSFDAQHQYLSLRVRPSKKWLKLVLYQKQMIRLSHLPGAFCF